MEEFNEQSTPESSQENELNLEIEPIKPAKETFKTNSWLFHVLCIFGVIISSLFFLCQVYLTPITVVGWSMLPNINTSTTSDSDTEHCDVVYYRAKDSYSRGDIVIVSNFDGQYISNDGKAESSKVYCLIKRVIACPGDKITFKFTSYENHKHYYEAIVTDKNGNVVQLNESSYINEKMYFDDRYTYTGFFTNIAPNILNTSLSDENRKSTITISDNCYFVMGDNRNHSSDSRAFGEVSAKDLLGSVRLHVKYGESIWTVLFEKLKSYLSSTYIFLKENL